MQRWKEVKNIRFRSSGCISGSRLSALPAKLKADDLRAKAEVGSGSWSMMFRILIGVWLSNPSSSGLDVLMSALFLGFVEAVGFVLSLQLYVRSSI